MSFGTILVSGLAILLALATAIESSVGEWLALSLIILAGIPHGSFDLRLAEAKWRESSRSRLSILAIYVSSGMAMSAFCIMFPTVGLALFLVISIIHFSEGEMIQGRMARGWMIGASSVVLPIGLHLTGSRAYLHYFIPFDLMESLSPFLRLLAVSLAVLLFIQLSRDSLKRDQDIDSNTLQRWICLGAWLLLPPLSGFCIWFIGRHSCKHLEVCKDLFRESRFGMPLDFLVISLVAILLIIPLSLFFDLRDINQLFAATIVLIAGLTVPHILVTHDLQKTMKQMRQQA